MWTFYQTGELIGPDLIRYPAYSGKGVHKNDPDSQNLKDRGPLPRGIYRIGDPFDSQKHGPFCLSLTPDSANVMFGRGGFLIHGDSIERPGEASEGCIIAPREARKQIYLSGERGLTVTIPPTQVVSDFSLMTD